jgi:hypothetical protein
VPRTPRARRLNPPHKQARPRTPPRYEYRAGAPEPTAADGGMAPPRWPRAAPALRPAPGTRPLWPPRRGPRRRTPRPRPRSTPPASNGGDIEAPWGSKLLTDADKWRAQRLNHRPLARVLGQLHATEHVPAPQHIQRTRSQNRRSQPVQNSGPVDYVAEVVLHHRHKHRHRPAAAWVNDRVVPVALLYVHRRERPLGEPGEAADGKHHVVHEQRQAAAGARARIPAPPRNSASRHPKNVGNLQSTSQLVGDAEMVLPEGRRGAAGRPVQGAGGAHGAPEHLPDVVLPLRDPPQVRRLQQHHVDVVARLGGAGLRAVARRNPAGDGQREVSADHALEVMEEIVCAPPPPPTPLPSPTSCMCLGRVIAVPCRANVTRGLSRRA